MTKLNKKLLERGYKFDKFMSRKDFQLYTKWVNGHEIMIYTEGDSLSDNFVCVPAAGIYSQEQIDNIQQAFNEMKKDLWEISIWELAE